MDKDTKFIIVLLIIIVILGGIFLLKKFSPTKDYTNIQINTTETNNQPSNTQISTNENIVTNNKIETNTSQLNKTQENIFKGINFWYIVLSLIAYVFLSLGIYIIAQNQNYSNSWLAFIPIIKWYLVAQIAFNGSSFIGFLYVLGKLIYIFWTSNILKWLLFVMGLYILYALFEKFSDRPNHTIGNLVAFEFGISFLGSYLAVNTFSSFWISFVIVGPSIIEGLYIFFISKKL